MPKPIPEDRRLAEIIRLISKFGQEYENMISGNFSAYNMNTEFKDDEDIHELWKIQ